MESPAEAAPLHIADRHLAEPVRSVDVHAELRKLRDEPAWALEGHNARTLVKNAWLRIVLVDLQGGAFLREHRTAGHIAIHCLAGSIRVTLPGREVNLHGGQMVALEENMPHGVEALEEATFLLTIAHPHP